MDFVARLPIIGVLDNNNGDRAMEATRRSGRKLVALLAIAWMLGAGAVQARETHKGLQRNADGTWGYVYVLPQDAASLYPDKSWLPPYYQPSYPDLATTIRTYTAQSIARDGISGASVGGVEILEDGRPMVMITGPDPDALDAFATMHARFLDAAHARQGLNGVALCQGTTGCWDPHPGAQPWAFFLPLGLPLSRQKAVTFLNYPPADSLRDVDYLDNFTMKRWAAVLETVGIVDPVRYETIVDARPIAAPGSGQASYMPDITTYFNQAGSDHDYVTPMLRLLTNPPARTGATSLPVMVLGSPSRQAWAAILGKSSVGLLEVGTATLPGAERPTAWVAGNHPDVTSYQCCPGDPHPSCQGSYDLVADEKIDLQVACIIQALAEDPGADPDTVKGRCAEQWALNPPPANQSAICVRARLDYNFEAQGQCPTPEAARAFCTHFVNNACPAGIYTCDTQTAGPAR